ncbi:MAG TPA: cytochrome c oxidase assembly protein [Parvibaculum sp.]
MKSWFTSKKAPAVLLSLGLLATMTTGVSYSPTLYRWFCAATGYGGSVTVKRSLDASAAQTGAAPAGDAKTAGGNPAVVNGIGPEITVRFDTNVAPGLDWEFKPEHPFVRTRIGLPTTVFFYAKNLSKETIVGRATYNVTPDPAGYYFTKTQCFCFTQEKLKPGEEAKMPVVFYVDPDMLTDEESSSIRTITLSYSFFRQSAEAVATARPLKGGSEAETQKLQKTKEAEFEPVEVKRQ